MNSSSKERKAFIENHRAEIAPLVENLSGQTPKAVLEAFETKFFVLEKNGNTLGKRVILDAAEPLAFNIVSALIDRLKVDPRCRSIALLADNVAGKRFLEAKDPNFRANGHFSSLKWPFCVTLYG